MTTICCFADVDDSLITSTRQCPIEGSVVAAIDGEGRVCGWLTPKQKTFLALLGEPVDMVLTTARSSKGVSQLKLPIAGYAICSFGGVILQPDGKPVPAFYQLAAAESACCNESLLALGLEVVSLAQADEIDVRVRVVEDMGLKLFLSVKHNQRNLQELHRLRDSISARLPAGWKLHANGNFIALLPAWLAKEVAVRWFMNNLLPRNVLTIGIGDSLTDLPFMSLCDIALMPTDAQNFAALRHKLP
jgi:hypothetical protein